MSHQKPIVERIAQESCSDHEMPFDSGMVFAWNATCLHCGKPWHELREEITDEDFFEMALKAQHKAGLA